MADEDAPKTPEMEMVAVLVGILRILKTPGKPAPDMEQVAGLLRASWSPKEIDTLDAEFLSLLRRELGLVDHTTVPTPLPPEAFGDAHWTPEEQAAARDVSEVAGGLKPANEGEDMLTRRLRSMTPPPRPKGEDDGNGGAGPAPANG